MATRKPASAPRKPRARTAAAAARTAAAAAAAAAAAPAATDRFSAGSVPELSGLVEAAVPDAQIHVPVFAPTVPDPQDQLISVDLYLGHGVSLDAPILRTQLPVRSVIAILAGVGWVEVALNDSPSAPSHPYGETRLLPVAYIGEIRLTGAFPPALRSWLLDHGYQHVALLKPLDA